MTLVQCMNTLAQKIDEDEKTKNLKITQLVLVQSLKVEFKFNEAKAKPEVPVIAGTHLFPNGPKLSAEDQTKYCSGVGNCYIS